MLVLSRKKEQAIRIGKDIVVRICHVDGYQVLIGIDAPRHVRVLREEVQPRDEKEQGNE